MISIGYNIMNLLDIMTPRVYNDNIKYTLGGSLWKGIVSFVENQLLPLQHINFTVMKTAEQNTLQNIIRGIDRTQNRLLCAKDAVKKFKLEIQGRSFVQKNVDGLFSMLNDQLLKNKKEYVLFAKKSLSLFKREESGSCTVPLNVQIKNDIKIENTLQWKKGLNIEKNTRWMGIGGLLYKEISGFANSVGNIFHFHCGQRKENWLFITKMEVEKQQVLIIVWITLKLFVNNAIDCTIPSILSKLMDSILLRVKFSPNLALLQ